MTSGASSSTLRALGGDANGVLADFDRYRESNNDTSLPLATSSISHLNPLCKDAGRFSASDVWDEAASEHVRRFVGYDRNSGRWFLRMGDKMIIERDRTWVRKVAPTWTEVSLDDAIEKVCKDMVAMLQAPVYDYRHDDQSLVVVVPAERFDTDRFLKLVPEFVKIARKSALEFSQVDATADHNKRVMVFRDSVVICSADTVRVLSLTRFHREFCTKRMYTLSLSTNYALLPSLTRVDSLSPGALRNHSSVRCRIDFLMALAEGDEARYQDFVALAANLLCRRHGDTTMDTGSTHVHHMLGNAAAVGALVDVLKEMLGDYAIEIARDDLDNKLPKLDYRRLRSRLWTAVVEQSSLRVPQCVRDANVDVIILTRNPLHDNLLPSDDPMPTTCVWKLPDKNVSLAKPVDDDVSMWVVFLLLTVRLPVACDASAAYPSTNAFTEHVVNLCHGLPVAAWLKDAGRELVEEVPIGAGGYQYRARVPFRTFDRRFTLWARGNFVGFDITKTNLKDRIAMGRNEVQKLVNFSYADAPPVAPPTLTHDNDDEHDEQADHVQAEQGAIRETVSVSLVAGDGGAHVQRVRRVEDNNSWVQRGRAKRAAREAAAPQSATDTID